MLHSSQFAPKNKEVFLVSYNSNGYSYRVFNNVTHIVEKTGDLQFDETNGSQVEHLEPHVVGDENDPFHKHNMIQEDAFPQSLKRSMSVDVEPPTSTPN